MRETAATKKNETLAFFYVYIVLFINVSSVGAGSRFRILDTPKIKMNPNWRGFLGRGVWMEEVEEAIK